MNTREQARRIRAEAANRPLDDLLEAYDQINDDNRVTTTENAYLNNIVIDATKKAIVDATPTGAADLAAHIRELADQHDNGAAASPSWKLRVRLVTDIAIKNHPQAEKVMAEWETDLRYSNPLEALADAIHPPQETS